MHAEDPGLDLPPYSLDVQAIELGADTKAVGLELIETESREPLRGSEAAEIWAAAFRVLKRKLMCNGAPPGHAQYVHALVPQLVEQLSTEPREGPRAIR